MPADHFVGETRQHSGHVELTAFGGDLRVKNDLEQEVAELLLQRRRVGGLDGLEDFVGFFDEERFQGYPRLLAIPRAPAGFPEPSHDLEEPFEVSAGRLGHDRFLSVSDYTAGVCACARLGPVAEAPDEGFRVTDRRRRDTTNTPSPPSDLPLSPSASTSSSSAPDSGTAPARSLVGLFMMLATEALIALGEAPDPVTGQQQRGLAHASDVIDVLSLLRDKTEGHRSADETRTLDDLIYDRQLRYVKAVKSCAR